MSSPRLPRGPAKRAPEGRAVEAFVAALSPWKRAAWLRRMLETVEVSQPAALGLDGAPRSAPRHEVIEAFIAAGAELIEETLKMRQHANNRVHWTMKRTLTIGIVGSRAWPSSTLTDPGLAFAMYLIERRR